MGNEAVAGVTSEAFARWLHHKVHVEKMAIKRMMLDDLLDDV